MWYEWNTKDEFNIWHNELCEELGYPLVGLNQQTKLPDENAEKTIDYTTAFKVQNKWIAWVDVEYSDDLIETELRLPQRDIRETLAE